MRPDELCICNYRNKIVFFTELYNHNCVRNKNKCLQDSNISNKEIKKISNKKIKKEKTIEIC